MNRWTLTLVRQERDDLTGDYEGPAVEIVVPDCVIAPTGSTEQSDRSETGDQEVTRRDVYPPDGVVVDVRSTDRARFPGETGAPWQVVGRPDDWNSPWSDWKRQVIRIERTSG